MCLDTRLGSVADTFPAIRMLVLFGSAAKGRTRKDSDVDVGVWFEEDCPGLRHEIELALGRAAGRPVDVVDLAAAPPQIRFEIAREGKLVMERTPHLWADFRARAMIDWWDWGPTARAIHAAAARRLRDRARHGPT